MNIGFDAKRLFHNPTGLGNYSRSSVQALQQFYPQNQYFLYTPKLGVKTFAKDFPSPENMHVRIPAGGFSPLWRTAGMVKLFGRDALDVYHGLSNELPIGVKKSGTAAVVTIHDLIFQRFPKYYPPIDRKIYNWKARYACKNADRIIAVSERTKQDIIHFYAIDANRIDVIYQGCDASFHTKKTAEEKNICKKRYKLPGEYLLSVGTIEERKNLELLIRALPLLRTKIPLVVVGKPTAYLQKIKEIIAEKQLQNQVLFLHDVTFADLPAIYQMASVFIYPSRYEGFGIPILEALHSGVPVIAATGSCLEEAGGPDSLYVSSDDHEALAGSVDLIFSDKIRRQKMIDKGSIYAGRFNNQYIADALMNCYKKTLPA